METEYINTKFIKRQRMGLFSKVTTYGAIILWTLLFVVSLAPVAMLLFKGNDSEWVTLEEKTMIIKDLSKIDLVSGCW